MIVVLADTHGSEGHRLEGAALEAVRAADLVVHAGDFTTGAVLAALEDEAAALAAVHGNNDDAAVRERLPAERVRDHAGVRLAVVHGHEHTATTLPLFGREAGADLVVVGHSHRPGFDRVGGTAVLNPGSHADPRQYRPGYATLRVDGTSLSGRIRDPDGVPFRSFGVALDREKGDR